MAKMFLECVFMKALYRWYPDRESNPLKQRKAKYK